VHDSIQWAVNVHIIAYIVFDEGKSLVPKQMGDILDPSGEKVVHADHGMSGLQQHIGEMAPEKPGSACNKDTHTVMLLLHSSHRECHEIYQDRSEKPARIVHDGSSQNRAVKCETGTRRPGTGSTVCGSACPVTQTGTDTKKKGVSPQQYVEGVSGEPAHRRLVAATNPRLQQKRS
jgi:hypothetical protein